MIKLLDGVRVIECAILPTGDQAGRLLGDLGAEVIKIERPGSGDYLRELGDRITPQNSVFHLLLNRNAIFSGGLRPHHYCIPVLKREPHRLALVKAATSGNPKFFLGTDSAPHARSAKESCCGSAGVFSAHTAIELYAEAFENANALDKLEGFTSHHGAAFYGLPRNTGRVTLERVEWEVPAEYPFGSATVVPMRAGEKLRWRLAV